MDDMLPRSRSSIRDIPVPANHRHVPPPPPPPSPERPRARASRRKWWQLAVAVVVVCAVAGLLLSTVFQGATVTLYPKTQNVAGPISLTLSPSADTAPAYQVISVRASASTTAPASGSATVSKQASGLITIYNGYSSASQQLVANTRFAAPDGKIYRIHSQVTVPGATGQPGSLTPGSVTATVYADQPGADYNQTDSITFTIPGFQGSPRYAAFSAKSQGALSGGFVGTQAVVSATDLATAKNTLHGQLDAALASQLAATLPAGFMPVGGSLSTTYDDVSQSGSGTTAQLSEGASASEAIVRASDVAAAVAAQAIQGYANDAVAFEDPTQVTVALSSPADLSGPLSVAVSGTMRVVWQFDSAAITQALAGHPRSSFEQVIQQFEPAVSAAKVSIRPFWKATFPSNPAKIHVTVSTDD